MCSLIYMLVLFGLFCTRDGFIANLENLDQIFTSKEPLKIHENDTLLCEFTCIYCIRVALYLMIYYFYKMN